MKPVKFFFMIILAASLTMLTRCSDDSPAVEPLVSVTGKVTYTDAAGSAANAAGAEVFLTNTETSAIITSVANNDGNFEFANIKSGAYTLASSYFTDNSNKSSGRFNGLNFSTEAPVAITVAAEAVTQDLSLVSVGQSNVQAMVIDYSWNGSSYANAAGALTYDATHTVVNFEFPYRQNVSSDFNGTFSQMSKVKINFDPNNLSASSIDVEVDVASFNTRSPGGRDPRTNVEDTPLFSPLTMFKELGCVMGTFGIAADGGVPSDATPLPMTTTKRYAQFVSNSISKLGDGYVAKGNLTFLGVTKATDIWFKAAPAWTDPSNNRTYQGFEGRFQMNAKADYGVNSSSVNDAAIKIQISLVAYQQ